VVSAFGREYARSGRLDPKLHRWRIDAQDFRNIGDHGLEAHVAGDQANLVREWAREFIEAAEGFLAIESGA